MKIKCDYCGNTFEDTLDRCPNCGAPNIARWDKDVRPKTIEDLKTWYRDKGLLPYNVTRFFIGEKVEEPRAFCIYKDDSGDFIVYKNKADGTRVIRYRGRDEEYAVNLLWERLKEEILHQKLVNRQKVNPTKVYNEVKSSDESSLSKKRGISHSGFSRESLRGLIVAFTLIICICVVIGVVIRPNGNSSGSNGTGYGNGTVSYSNNGNSGLSSWVDDDDFDSGSSLNWFGGSNSGSGSSSSWYGESGNSWWDNDSNSSSGWSDSTSWWDDDDDGDDFSWSDVSSWFSSGSDWDSSSWSSSSWDNDYSWSSSDSWSSSSSSWDSDW